MLLFEDSKFKYIYNNEGQIIKQQEYSKNEFGEWYLYHLLTNEYDTNGNKILRVEETNSIETITKEISSNLEKLGFEIARHELSFFTCWTKVR